jgi:hypothetical protein
MLRALRLVRWPGIFHSRWLTCAIGYPSVVGCSLPGLAQREDPRRLCKKAYSLRKLGRPMC